MEIMTRRLLSLALLSMASAFSQNPTDWTEPFAPYKVAGNLYYVGSRGLASYLVTTPQGHILINSSLEESVPLIQASVAKLGFKFEDVKILLISHAHWDHCAGSAAVKKRTGAQYMVMQQDVSEVETGGAADFYYHDHTYPRVKVDRVLKDGDTVKLGGSVLTAHLTPGHTPGNTTWTMQVNDEGRVLNAVIVGSTNVNDGYKLVHNNAYPRIAGDFEQTFRVLKSLPADLFLGAHGSYFGMEAKYALLRPNAPNPFVDPKGYRDFVADREKAFRQEWDKQKASVK
jgi:metallo-beta-lactamase class B